MDVKKIEERLPEWASVGLAEGEDRLRIDIDPAKAYPAWLKELGIAKKDWDQYWLEVAYQCSKMDVQAAIVPVIGHFGFSIKIIRCEDLALAKFPEGRGIEVATQGKEARGS